MGIFSEIGRLLTGRPKENGLGPYRGNVVNFTGNNADEVIAQNYRDKGFSPEQIEAALRQIPDRAKNKIAAGIADSMRELAKGGRELIASDQVKDATGDAIRSLSSAKAYQIRTAADGQRQSVQHFVEHEMPEIIQSGKPDEQSLTALLSAAAQSLRDTLTAGDHARRGNNEDVINLVSSAPPDVTTIVKTYKTGEVSKDKSVLESVRERREYRQRGETITTVEHEPQEFDIFGSSAAASVGTAHAFVERGDNGHQRGEASSEGNSAAIANLAGSVHVRGGRSRVVSELRNTHTQNH